MTRGLMSLGLCALQLLLIMPANAAAANSASQRIGGTINDALGRPVDRAELILQTQDGRIIARARSDRSGHFEFADIRPGTYAIVANKQGFATATSIVTVTARGAKPVDISMEAQTALNMQVVAKRLDVARNGLSPETGSSVYRFSEKAIQELPQGTNTQLSNVLLQAPGVVQDSFGALHIRGEHAEIQYRINGIELPEGVSSAFSQSFSPRFARSISLLEGALPAQYGYHTAGVVQIQTKTGESLSGGNIEMYGGQRGTLQPSFELGGANGNLSYYTTGYYLQNNRALEPPTPGPEAIHDFATIGNDFSYLSYFLNPTTRISLFGGFNLSNFEIPANPDQCPAFNLAGVPNSPSATCPALNPAGVPNFPSANVRETQLEQNYYGVLALQGIVGKNLDYQIAAFSRYSTLSFHPDQTGDLIYNGIASRVFRGDWANGLQGDFAYRVLATHTIRAGYYFQGERAEIDNHALVFPGGPGGQTSDESRAIVDNTALTSWLYGLYLQDEWKPISKLTINYGVRFDLYDGLTRADQASPRVGAVYQLFEKTALHAAYARYFTPPPLESVSGESIFKFVGTTNEPAVRTNSNIAPERAHYFDAGITQNLPYDLKVDLDSYYKKSRDLIDEGQFGPTLVFTPFNYDKGRQYGVEFSTSLTRENLTAYTNFAYSVAQGINIVSDQFLFGADELSYIKNHYVFLDHDQTFSASWGIAYNYDGFLFTVDGFYGSGLRTGFANTGNLPFYIQFDAGVAKRLRIPKIGNIEGRVAVINLGDWIYQIRNGSGIGVFASQYGPRRAVEGGLKWFFPWSKPSALTQ
jgi:outer membrane receptor protein involved in Fe transport